MTETERAVLWELGRPGGGGSRGPADIAGQLTVKTGTYWSWQGVASVARRLKSLGLITIRSYTKATFYEITDAGREELTGLGLVPEQS